MQLMSVRDVAARLAVSRSSVYRLMRDHGLPKPLHIGEGRSAWREDEIVAWIEARSEAR